MGIPKFFRWLSERYPKINQRYGSIPNPETVQRHFNDPDLDPSEFYQSTPPDPLSLCNLPPEIDRLYIDMNGILHGCSHNNAKIESEDDTLDEFETDTSTLSVSEIFRNVEYYLDRIVTDIAKPKELVYMAIDGVAPRAKLNQQRSRRFRSGQEGKIEQTLYEAHLEAIKNQSSADTNVGDPDSVVGLPTTATFGLDDLQQLQEVQPGRFAGKITAQSSAPRSAAPADKDDNDAWMDQPFHSHFITPGTAFMEAVSKRIQEFVQRKIQTDPKWQNLTIIFSGSEVPGEGEHKIMDFIRHQKSEADPNTRHCIVGQDGDLIILGLVAHEPNLVLLRERVEFSTEAEQIGINGYIHNPNFEFLHINILRDYLAYDLETSDGLTKTQFDLEHTIDDFCFMTFLIGNDFLPHLPALDIADEALELLFDFYKKQRHKWIVDEKQPPYLTYRGNIVSGSRLQDFLKEVGVYEEPYYDNKRRVEIRENEQMRSHYKKLGLNQDVFPTQEVLELKEEADRARYRQMLQLAAANSAAEINDFQPVMSSSVATNGKTEERVERGEGYFSRLGNLLQISLKPNAQNSLGSSTPTEQLSLDDKDLKGRYYYDKFGFTPFDRDRHIALRKAYVEGLIWNLKYYYEGCVSWDWHYPFHYGPILSDLVDLDEIINTISFEGKLGRPLKPFEQLLACLPPSSAFQLPKPYRWLMTDPNSPISDFYPRSFVIDMNGKRWVWEAVALLPFVDKDRLLQAVAKVKVEKLSENEARRNETGQVLVLERNSVVSGADLPLVSVTPFDSTKWRFKPEAKPVFEPRLTPGVVVPLPSFSTLKSVPINKLYKLKSGIQVFNCRSRYFTAFLETTEDIPVFPPLDVLAPKFIGETCFFNYPHFTEAFITAVSNSTVEYRGKDSTPIPQNGDSSSWDKRYKVLCERHAIGEGLPGTGGWRLPTTPTKEAIKLYVRPFKGFKTLPDGTVTKLYSPFEIEVPLISAIWSPVHPDPRLSDLHLLLEKDPYHMELLRWQSSTAKDSNAREVSVLPSDILPVELTNSTADEVGSSIVGSIFGSNPSQGLQLLPGFEDKRLTSNHVLPLPDSLGDLERPEKFEVYDRLSSRFKSSTTTTDGNSSSSCLGNENESLLLAKLDKMAESSKKSRIALPRKRTYCTSSFPVAPRPRGQIHNKMVFIGFMVAAAATFGAKLVSGSQPTEFSGNNRARAERSTSFLIDRPSNGYGMEYAPAPVPDLEFAHGTTTLSFVFKGGIITAVDSRATIGNFVGSKTTQKVLPVNSHVLATMAGGAADCSVWIRKLRAEAWQHESDSGNRMTVARVSRLLSNWLYAYRGQGLSVGTMVMGFDEDGTSRIYYVDNSGTRLEGKHFAVGSGSTFALGILDNAELFNLTEDEAISLGIKAIRHATFRDAMSGGFINVYLITKDGYSKVFSEDLAHLQQGGKEVELVHF